MIPLSLEEYILKRSERQIIDIKFAGQLWDIYQNHTTLMNTMREICVVGIDIWQENLNILSTAVDCTDQDILVKYKKDLVDSISFLDCFGTGVGQNNAVLTRKLFQEMKKDPKKWFKDVGKVGGFFRGYAETSENTMNVLFEYHKNTGLKDRVMNVVMKADPSLSLGKALFNDSDFKKNIFSLQQRGAILALLEREFDGRLSHQKKLVRRNMSGVKIRWVSGPLIDAPVICETYRYSAEWFSKWQRKGDVNPPELNSPEDQFKKQRAREAKSESIPAWIRPWIKVPSHQDPSDKQSWRNAGIYKWNQMNWDRLWLIAQLFGLPPGATISGTTTDHMFTIYEVMTRVEQMAKKQDIHMQGLARRIQQYLPYLHLIPVIQMGSQMHHAICEMGSALSLNDFISYHVGYYTSLLPSPKQMAVTDQKLDTNIRTVLRQAEKQAPHLYAVGAKYWKGDRAQIAAYLVDPTNKEERMAHRQSALLDPENAAEWEKIPTDITLEYIRSKAKKIDPSIT